MRIGVFGIWLALVASIAPVASQAQQPRQRGGEPLFTSGDALWAAGLVTGTVALAPLDIRIAEAVRDSALQANRVLSFTSNGLRLLGFPGSVLVTGGMYTLGRLGDRPALAEIGLHSAGAIVIASAITLGTKSLAGRARPYADPEDPLDFALGRGWMDDRYQSFPSGHAAAAFATAAAITAEVGERWADSELLVGGALFSAATLVGASRLYHNVHWASDVAAGAGIGTFVGWKVVKYMHSHPDNRVDRWLLGMTISPTPHGSMARLWLVPDF